MCTLALLRRPGHRWPVIVAANRDEMVNRPWVAPARHWPDRPEVVAGRDELGGGTWLGLNDFGVVAGILNRVGSLGPAPGQRSRGELVLEALDHADAAAAAAALTAIDPRAYRTFNLIIADNRDAFWLRHADESGAAPVSATAIPPGLAMITAGDLNDHDKPRLRRYWPLFEVAAAPDPDRDDWRDWEALLDDRRFDPADGPIGAMRFALDQGFATVSSSLIALPAAEAAERKAIFRFAGHQPTAVSWHPVDA